MSAVSATDNRIHAVYEFDGIEDAEQVALGLVVEETIEYPRELVADQWLRDEVIGRVEDVSCAENGRQVAHVTYPVEDVGGEIPQLLSMLFGNCSLWPGVRLVDVAFPSALLAMFPGPRFGVAGVRNMTGAIDRPLLATAIKPLGSSTDVLASMAYELAAGGIDVIKDDQGLANQSYAPFEQRVAHVASAIRTANEQFGTHAIYAPCISGPTEQLDHRVEFALTQGAAGLMVLPGIAGFDVIRYLASRDDVNVPILAHPSMLGAFTASSHHGIAPNLIYGTLPR
jgi:ribulose-bisphosphate carboxylase large chain